MSEWSAVQEPLLRYAQDIGWATVSQEEAVQQRGGETGLFFEPVLREQLKQLNPGIVGDSEVEDILRRLRLLKPTIDGNRDLLSWLRGEQSVFVPAENRERNVRLIDFDSSGNNVFEATVEWVYQGHVFTNRADVVMLINGIPIAVCEAKNANKPDGLETGVDQIRRYHHETPELLTIPQLFEVTHLWSFYYGPTWATNRKNIFDWKDDEPRDFERKVKAFFDKSRFLRLLRDYIIFLNRDDTVTKVILRQHQTRAVEKVVERAVDVDKRRGLIWHTQGSGKTLTMITVASRLLREAHGGEKPTVLMIVDRNELEQQLFKNIASYGIASLEVAESKVDLQRLLGRDYRGLIVSTIHKFDGIDADVNTRDSVIVLVDEAHRSTGGDFGNYMLGALPNATYIGFTGTPIDRLSHGEGTFKVFGIDDEQGYLDKYSIAESIEDGATVRLNYSLAPSDLRVDPETLNREFLGLAESEGVDSVEELNAILNRAVVLKEIMKAPSRIEKVADRVAQHFRENVEPLGFKAFLVAVDREACALYYEALNGRLPKGYADVVYSPYYNDHANLKAHYHSPEEEEQIRTSFRSKGSLPKILIVTEKLLTGFDAPILYCMYLDKPMRDHVLLQAIARVNRPYEDDDGLVKPYGLVFDFVGIFEKLESALAFDSDFVTSVIQNIDVLKDRFATLMAQTAPQYLPLTEGRDDKAKERAVDHLNDPDARDTFFRFFRELETLYDIISPDVFLRTHLDDYQALAELFAIIHTAYSDRPYVDHELAAKTRLMLREHSTTYSLDLPGAIHKLGPDELEALKQSDTSDTVKVLNLRKALASAVQDAGAKPYLIPIGERAEALAKLYDDRQFTTQQALLAYEKLTQEAVDGEAERESLGMDENTYGIFVVLRTEKGEELTPQDARDINALFQRFPDFQWDAEQTRQLRAEVYGRLSKLLGHEKFMDATNRLMNLRRV